MTTIDKLIDSIANICINLGPRGEYSPEEIADLVCDIEFVHLYDALRDLAEPVYAFSTDGERPMTLKYRSRKLFDRNATLLWREPVLCADDTELASSRYLELWLLEDMSVAVVSCVQIVYGDECDYITEYREYKGEEIPFAEPVPDLGDRKTALFIIMSDTDDTFNFLISLCYTQLFNLLCEKADDVYGGRLPVHVRCLIDEAANIGQIPRLEKLVATIRSREISCCLVLQAQSQLKAIYKDNADTIIGNMDTSIFLGGKEPTTLKELSAALGKETIDVMNTGESRGREVSHSLNYQKLGKELMSQDELAVMDGGKCVLQLRGVRPFLSNKYDITKHPNYKYTSDFDKRNELDLERFLSHRLRLKADAVCEVYEVNPSGTTA